MRLCVDAFAHLHFYAFTLYAFNNTGFRYPEFFINSAYLVSLVHLVYLVSLVSFVSLVNRGSVC